MERFLLMRLSLFSVLILTFCTGIHALTMQRLKMPEMALTTQSVTLECLYDLDSDDLYSVKFYKDSNEFYRYMPRELRTKQKWSLPGIQVNLEQSSEKRVVLENVDVVSSGDYTCEVGVEAPSFATVRGRSQLTVIAIPETRPQITGARETYGIGDTVRVNCTSLRSKPAAHIEWYINGCKVSRNMIERYPIYHEEDGFQSSTVGLEFVAQEGLFSRDRMILRCDAVIGYLYYRQANFIVTKETTTTPQNETNCE